MSYEGYEQVLCENGHYFVYDCYMWDWFGEGESDDWHCPFCEAALAWSNSVDTTNEGYINEDGSIEPAYGYVELHLIDDVRCKLCGHIIEQRFKIPKGREDE